MFRFPLHPVALWPVPSRACVCESASRPPSSRSASQVLSPAWDTGCARLRTFTTKTRSHKDSQRIFINKSLIHFLSHHESKPAPFFVRLCAFVSLCLCVFVPLWWLRLHEVQPVALITAPAGPGARGYCEFIARHCDDRILPIV